MSIAGKKSSLGDEYQLRIALHWLIRMLEEDTIESIQVNSTGLPGENSSVTVDDIVILYKNGHACFIQAKKNQTSHKAWSFSDSVLKEELCKARDQLESRDNSQVKFYSRSPFGAFASLVENCGYFSEYSAFHREADKNQQESLNSVSTILERTKEISYDLVKKISFGSPQGFDEWDRQNNLDLARILPKVNIVMSLLERYLVSHETNLRDSKCVLTRSDVLAELAKHGLSPTPKRSEAEILATFKQASSIGRNWLRTIDGKTIPRSELSKIIELIEQESESILLIDRPGSGKTCILLDLADFIEREKAELWGFLFIKGDKFTNAATEQDLVAQGLPEDIVGQCARLADSRKVVVVIDSLDVLSLNRQHDSLKVFLGIIDRLEKLDGATIITACRSFDLKYDPLLRGRSWQHRIDLQPLDFNKEVKPFLINWNVDISKINLELKALLQIPQYLRIYGELAKRGIQLQSASAYELYNSFLEEIIVKNQTLGNEAIAALQNMAEELMRGRSQSCSKVSFGTSEEIVRQLISQEVLSENSHGSLEFSHQTLRECITVRAALAKKQTLAQFILEHPQLPFIRPAVRAFFFYLRAYQPDIFRRQVWEVLSHNEIAYHVKRLVCESLSEISPVDDDWRSLRRIFQNYPHLFRRLLSRVYSRAWFDILRNSWFPDISSASERETWLLQFVHHLNVWMNTYPVEVVALWKQAIETEWANKQNILGKISSVLRDFKAWNTEGIREILEAIIENTNTEYDFVGKSLSKWVQATNSGDDLLWKYITKNVSTEEAYSLDIARKLRCTPHHFCEDNFLEARVEKSDILLNLVLDELESWNAAISVKYRIQGLQNHFLESTSWRLKHSKRDMHFPDDISILLDAVEKAIKYRVRQNSDWWLENEPRLQNSKELAIRYFLIQAYKENIPYVYGLESLLKDEEVFRGSKLCYELGELMQISYHKISESAQIANQAMILLLCNKKREYEEKYSLGVYKSLYDLCISIPSIFRSIEIQNRVEDWQSYFGYITSEANIYSWGGCVLPPLSPQDLLKLSNKGLFQLLHYYETHQDRDSFDMDMIGGFSNVKSVLRDACALNPKRFIILFPRFIEEELHKEYVCALVEGVASHLRYRFGNLTSLQEWKPVQPLPEGESIAATLLNWLERNFLIWEDGRTVATALEACCDVLIDCESAERLSLLFFWLYNQFSDDREFRKNNNDLLSTAINSVHGVAVESAIKLCNKLLEKEQPVPEMLLLLLRHAASDTAIYVRIPVLRNLPFLMYKQPNLGWQLLADIFKESQTHLWKYTERCFYYQYENNFEQVSPYLNRLLDEGMEESGDIWGVISTLSTLARHITQEELFAILKKTNNQEAWKGVTQVFVANLALPEHTEKCISGLIIILHQQDLSQEIIREIGRCFKGEDKRNYITRELAFTFLEKLPASTSNNDLDGFLEWLGYESRRNPLSAMELTEVLVKKFETTINAEIFWHTEPLIAALNEILREADERDEPQLIQRAISLQDRFLILGIHGMEELLNKAGQE
ncbi:MAG: ATP-binding protein [Nostocales cyanobacterium 94392]|nr:ATP-binding protein [Nostocales cyanobacterium 94392]